MKNTEKVIAFNERFSELCAGNTLTDVEMSRALKVSKQTISAWKKGTRSPKEPTITMIAQHFHVSVKWLLGFDVDKYDQDQQESVVLPKTIEARIVSAGMDDLPQDDREILLSIYQTMMRKRYPEIFGKGDEK